MSPRPRKVTDAELFRATHAVMNRVGPGELTLAAIAKEAGVTAAVLVQRFGSKRELLLALSKRFAGEAGNFIAHLASEHRSPLAALRAYADCMAGMAVSPAALARSLAYLQIDLTDPDFRKHLLAQAQATRAGLTKLIAEAAARGELVDDVSATRLARTLEAVMSGSLLTWAFYQKGKAVRWLRADVEAVLEPYLPRRRRSPKPSPSVSARSAARVRGKHNR